MSYIQVNSFCRNLSDQKKLARYIQSDERKKLYPRILYLARLSFRSARRVLQTSNN